MSFWITVFNHKNIGKITTGKLLESVRESNLRTLCEQYGLDPALIDPAMANFEVLSAPTAQPIMVIKYRPEGERPVILYRWDTDSLAGADYIEKVVGEVTDPLVEQHLQKTSEVFGLELEESNLGDMGLVLAYELARWLAFRGDGLILGLDSVWYQLNPHKAFIPLQQG